MDIKERACDDRLHLCPLWPPGLFWLLTHSPWGERDLATPRSQGRGQGDLAAEAEGPPHPGWFRGSPLPCQALARHLPPSPSLGQISPELVGVGVGKEGTGCSPVGYLGTRVWVASEWIKGAYQASRARPASHGHPAPSSSMPSGTCPSPLPSPQPSALSLVPTRPRLANRTRRPGPKEAMPGFRTTAPVPETARWAGRPGRREANAAGLPLSPPRALCTPTAQGLGQAANWVRARPGRLSCPGITTTPDWAEHPRQPAWAARPTTTPPRAQAAAVRQGLGESTAAWLRGTE